ncbi:endonuclease [Shewanella sp. GutDb-MelDb]|uniref:endonuclease n=1 Tax=Shewanella sp. GutDb-MelDb TaxID=2058316 RepID=UPI000C7D0561|nr:endonuclease [Shewanella sp. GutDb-MelDb]PKG56997.1 hypothetical protein CXF82_11750 [Shewanella sp. GutDb-MelDb]
MKRLLLLTAFLSVSSAYAAKGDICTNCPDITPIANRADFDITTYYASANAADNTDMVEFKKAINKDISARHKQLSYAEVWTALTFTDEDPANANNVILLYKGNSIPKNQNASGVNNPDYWNREHVWAKSHGFPKSSQHGYTDIHHLRPSDTSMNSQRSNNDFDNGGSAVAEAPDNLKNGSISWEPREAVKGDVARMMFYMDTRYEVGSDTDMPDLVLVDRTGTATNSDNSKPGEMGKLCTLLEWHANDPVDNFERNRNDVVFEYQGNRNPYVDHPEWTDFVYKNKCSDIPAVTPSVSIAATEPVIEGDSVTLTATANITDAIFLWEQTSGADVKPVDTDSATLTFIAPKVTMDTDFGFKVTINDSQEAKANNEISITVKDKFIASPFRLDIAAVSVVSEAQQVSLIGSSNGDKPTYQWAQTAGPKVNLASTTQAELVFTAPSVSLDSMVSFSLTVKDSLDQTITKTVNLTVRNTDLTTPTEPTKPTTESSGGALGSLWIGVLVLLGLRRRIR